MRKLDHCFDINSIAIISNSIHALVLCGIPMILLLPRILASSHEGGYLLFLDMGIGI